ncbi:winged helix-turn-helix transcriptional regulator [Catenulispora rubra]|uniref:winged helix-turn-helix transcriptional regulator n=1 Tax=Catenulispora rubra TaxID=280293 RepID=UPI001E30E9A9|nr:helix-turn-helix domain-containing protein [Catenulispora rubra]
MEAAREPNTTATRETATTGEPFARPAASGSAQARLDADSASMSLMREQPLRPRPCSVAAALDILGERWSLLAIREMGYGVHTFAKIAAYTGASRDILTSRLRNLEEAGVIERRLYNEHPPRFEYHLTAAGRDLLPVMATLRAWGDKYVVDQPAMQVRHSCGHELEIETACTHCGKAIDGADMTPILLKSSLRD